MAIEIVCGIGCYFLHSSLSKVKLNNEEKAGVGEGSGVDGRRVGGCESEGWVAISNGTELFH